MKKFISTLSCLLIVCFACLAFVGCSGSKDKDQPTTHENVDLLTAVANFKNATNLTVSDEGAIVKIKNSNTPQWEVLAEDGDISLYMTKDFIYTIDNSETPAERTKEATEYVCDSVWAYFNSLPDAETVFIFIINFDLNHLNSASIKSYTVFETVFDYTDADGYEYTIHVDNETNKITKATFKLNEDVTWVETYSYATLPETLFDVSGEWN